MDPALLENYEFQLEQIREQLEVDPENEALQKLAADLEELIALTRGLPPTEDAQDQPEQDTHKIEAPKSPQKKTPKKSHADDLVTEYQLGAEVMARFTQDGRWYQARIDARDAQGRYQVTYTGYG